MARRQVTILLRDDVMQHGVNNTVARVMQQQENDLVMDIVRRAHTALGGKNREE
jgi:hypothetical protein